MKPRMSPTIPKAHSPLFAAVWQRIEGHTGKQFTTVTGLPFTYAIAHGVLRPSRANRNLPRSDFEKAMTRVPLNSTRDVKDLQGPAYVYAILMDERIRAGEW